MGVGEWRLDNHVDHVEQVEGKRVRGCGRGGFRIRSRRRRIRRSGESSREDSQQNLVGGSISHSHFGKRGLACFPKMGMGGG